MWKNKNLHPKSQDGKGCLGILEGNFNGLCVTFSVDMHVMVWSLYNFLVGIMVGTLYRLM